MDLCTPPEAGVLHFTTGPNESAMETLQARFPEVRMVNAFNSVGAGRMLNPDYEQGPRTMFICGNDADAKITVGGILEQFGWDPPRHGAGYLCPGHRASLHALVHSRVPREPMGPRVQVA